LIFAPFFARLASKFSKSANMTPKFFWGKIKKDIKIVVPYRQKRLKKFDEI
jgi:hypothetical protein